MTAWRAFVALLTAFLLAMLAAPSMAQAEEFRSVRDTRETHFRTFVREASRMTGEAAGSGLENALLTGNACDFILRGVDAAGTVHWAHSGRCDGSWMNRRAGLTGTTVTRANFCPTCVRSEVWTIEGRRVQVPQTATALATLRSGMTTTPTTVTPPVLATRQTPPPQVSTPVVPATNAADAARTQAELAHARAEVQRLQQANANLRRQQPSAEPPTPNGDEDHQREDRRLRERLRESWPAHQVLWMTIGLATVFFLLFTSLGMWIGRKNPLPVWADDREERDGSTPPADPATSSKDAHEKYGMAQSMRPPPMTGTPQAIDAPSVNSDRDQAAARELEKLAQADAQKAPPPAADLSPTQQTMPFGPKQEQGPRKVIFSERTGEAVEVEEEPPPRRESGTQPAARVEGAAQKSRNGAEYAGPGEKTFEMATRHPKSS